MTYEMPIIDEHEYTFISCDGHTPIHVHEWVPDCDLNGVIQIAHGVAEYIDRYDRFARYLCSKGFAVVGNDHLGHGQSTADPDCLGWFADENGWMKVVGDIEKLRVTTQEKFKGLPYFMYGHSMGSFLMRTWLCIFSNCPVNGMILSGTGQNPYAVTFAGAMLCDEEILRLGAHAYSEIVDKAAFGGYNKNFEPARTRFDWLSRDEAEVDKYIADPYCGFDCSVGLFRDLMFGLKYIAERRNLKNANKKLPIYLMSGDKDPVGSNGMGVAKVYAMLMRAGITDVKYKLYPDGRHEMHNEINRDEVMKDLSDWIFSKIDNEGF